MCMLASVDLFSCIKRLSTFGCCYCLGCVILLVGGGAVIKAQVLAGGRGKGRFTSGLEGGVVLAKTYENRV